MKTLDLITIGRSSVDLYGDQIGGRLEDMGSFSKYIGGSPTNIACGTARLGLKSAIITRVGDEHMGRFIIEQLAREGVDPRGVKTDPERLTALVILGIRDDAQFPLIFYRENCADMGLAEEDIDEGFIAEARAVLATGTHLSHSRTEAAVLKALKLARKHGARTALDIDYRPNLWGVAGHGEGESRFVESAAVTRKLQSTLHFFDLIVGTEEEFHIAGGSTDTIAALRAVRMVCDATLVCKRGARGAVAFEGPIPDNRGFGCINRLQIECGGAEFNNMYKDSNVEVQPEIDFVAHAASMGAHAEKATDIADLEARIVAARGRDIPTVIVIETDAVPGTGAGGHWWDVAVPQAGGPERLEKARERYEENTARQRLFN